MVNSGNVGAKRHVLNVKKGDVEIEVGTDDIDTLMRSGWAKGLFGKTLQEEAEGLQVENQFRKELREQRQRMGQMQELLTDVVQQMREQQRLLREPRQEAPMRSQQPIQQPMQQPMQQPPRPPVRDPRVVMRQAQQQEQGKYLDVSPQDMNMEKWNEMSPDEREQWQKMWLGGQ